MVRKTQRKNSNRKGKVGELEWCKYLREHNIDAHRSQQYCGVAGDADVVGLSGYHQEIKRVERININNAMAQAVRDCGDNVPIVAHRRNRGRWLVTMLADDWINLINNGEMEK